jgi:hypothetical protein
MSRYPVTSKRAHPILYDAVLFVALLATALALAGALAHAFELPNKIDLPRDEYFIVQNIYRGWWQFAYVLAAQLLAIIALIILARQQPGVVWPAVVALACLVAAQVLFWTYTYPANAATANWTTIPENWATLRNQWEYSHAAGAAFQFIAMVSLIIAALARVRYPVD